MSSCGYSGLRYRDGSCQALSGTLYVQGFAGAAGPRVSGFGEISSADILGAVGQCLKGGVAGATTGTTISPGMGTAIGAGVGCVTSMLTGILTGGGASQAQAQALIAQQQAQIAAQVAAAEEEERERKKKADQQKQYLILGGIGLVAVIAILAVK